MNKPKKPSKEPLEKSHSQAFIPQKLIKEEKSRFNAKKNHQPTNNNPRITIPRRQS